MLDDLELNLDVLQKELKIPAQFQFVKGLIRSLRVHIPWMALQSQAVEITLQNIKCIVRHCTSEPRPNPTAPPSTPASTTGSAPPPAVAAKSEDNSSNWVKSLLLKVASNLTVKIQGIELVYLQDNIRATVSLREAHIFSADADWNPNCIDLIGPWKRLHKVLKLTGLSASLSRDTPASERHGAAGPTSGRPDAKSRKKNRDTRGLILDGLSMALRVRAYVGGARTRLNKTLAVALASSNDFPETPIGPTVSVDAQILHGVDVHLTRRHVELFFSIASSFKQGSQDVKDGEKSTNAQSPRPPRCDIPATPDLVSSTTGATLGTGTDDAKGRPQQQGWLSYALSYVVETGVEPSGRDREEAEILIQKVKEYAPKPKISFQIRVRRVHVHLINSSGAHERRKSSLSGLNETDPESPVLSGIPGDPGRLSISIDVGGGGSASVMGLSPVPSPVPSPRILRTSFESLNNSSTAQGPVARTRSIESVQRPETRPLLARLRSRAFLTVTVRDAFSAGVVGLGGASNGAEESDTMPSQRNDANRVDSVLVRVASVDVVDMSTGAVVVGLASRLHLRRRFPFLLIPDAEKLNVEAETPGVEPVSLFDQREAGQDAEKLKKGAEKLKQESAAPESGPGQVRGKSSLQALEICIDSAGTARKGNGKGMAGGHTSVAIGGAFLFLGVRGNGVTALAKSLFAFLGPAVPTFQSRNSESKIKASRDSAESRDYKAVEGRRLTLIVQHACVGIRVTDASEWKFDQFRLRNRNCVTVEATGVTVDASILPVSKKLISSSPRPAQSRQRLVGTSLSARVASIRARFLMIESRALAGIRSNPRSGSTASESHRSLSQTPTSSLGGEDAKRRGAPATNLLHNDRIPGTSRGSPGGAPATTLLHVDDARCDLRFCPAGTSESEAFLTSFVSRLGSGSISASVKSLAVTLSIPAVHMLNLATAGLFGIADRTTHARRLGTEKRPRGHCSYALQKWIIGLRPRPSTVPLDRKFWETDISATVTSTSVDFLGVSPLTQLAQSGASIGGISVTVRRRGSTRYVAQGPFSAPTPTTPTGRNIKNIKSASQQLFSLSLSIHRHALWWLAGRAQSMLSGTARESPGIPGTNGRLDAPHCSVVVSVSLAPALVVWDSVWLGIYDYIAITARRAQVTFKRTKSDAQIAHRRVADTGASAHVVEDSTGQGKTQGVFDGEGKRYVDTGAYSGGAKPNFLKLVGLLRVKVSTAPIYAYIPLHDRFHYSTARRGIPGDSQESPVLPAIWVCLPRIEAHVESPQQMRLHVDGARVFTGAADEVSESLQLPPIPDVTTDIMSTWSVRLSIALARTQRTRSYAAKLSSMGSDATRKGAGGVGENESDGVTALDISGEAAPLSVRLTHRQACGISAIIAEFVKRTSSGFDPELLDLGGDGGDASGLQGSYGGEYTTARDEQKLNSPDARGVSVTSTVTSSAVTSSTVSSPTVVSDDNDETPPGLPGFPSICRLRVRLTTVSIRLLPTSNTAAQSREIKTNPSRKINQTASDDDECIRYVLKGVTSRGELEWVRGGSTLRGLRHVGTFVGAPMRDRGFLPTRVQVAVAASELMYIPKGGNDAHLLLSSRKAFLNISQRFLPDTHSGIPGFVRIPGLVASSLPRPRAMHVQAYVEPIRAVLRADPMHKLWKMVRLFVPRNRGSPGDPRASSSPSGRFGSSSNLVGKNSAGASKSALGTTHRTTLPPTSESNPGGSPGGSPTSIALPSSVPHVSVCIDIESIEAILLSQTGHNAFRAKFDRLWAHSRLPCAGPHADGSRETRALRGAVRYFISKNAATEFYPFRCKTCQKQLTDKEQDAEAQPDEKSAASAASATKSDEKIEATFTTEKLSAEAGLHGFSLSVGTFQESSQDTKGGRGGYVWSPVTNDITILATVRVRASAEAERAPGIPGSTGEISPVIYRIQDRVRVAAVLRSKCLHFNLSAKAVEQIFTCVAILPLQPSPKEPPRHTPPAPSGAVTARDSPGIPVIFSSFVTVDTDVGSVIVSLKPSSNSPLSGKVLQLTGEQATLHCRVKSHDSTRRPTIRAAMSWFGRGSPGIPGDYSQSQTRRRKETTGRSALGSLRLCLVSDSEGSSDCDGKSETVDSKSETVDSKSETVDINLIRWRRPPLRSGETKSLDETGVLSAVWNYKEFSVTHRIPGFRGIPRRVLTRAGLSPPNAGELALTLQGMHIRSDFATVALVASVVSRFVVGLRKISAKMAPTRQFIVCRPTALQIKLFIKCGGLLVVGDPYPVDVESDGPQESTIHPRPTVNPNSTTNRYPFARVRWGDSLLLKLPTQATHQWRAATLSTSLEASVLKISASLGMVAVAASVPRVLSRMFPLGETLVSDCDLKLNVDNKWTSFCQQLEAPPRGIRASVCLKSETVDHKSSSVALKLGRVHVDMVPHHVVIVAALVTQAISVVSSIKNALPSAPDSPMEVSFSFSQDDFRSMRLQETVETAQETAQETGVRVSAEISDAPRAVLPPPNHISFSPGRTVGGEGYGSGLGSGLGSDAKALRSRWLCWRYPFPRSVTTLMSGSLASLFPPPAARPEKLNCSLRAWDSLGKRFVEAGSFECAVSAPTRHSFDHETVSNVWILTWHPPRIERGQPFRWPAASELGQFVRVDSKVQVPPPPQRCLEMTVSDFRIALSDVSVSSSVPRMAVSPAVSGETATDDPSVTVAKRVFAYVEGQGMNVLSRQWNSAQSALSIGCNSVHVDAVDYLHLTRTPLLLPFRASVTVKRALGSPGGSPVDAALSKCREAGGMTVSVLAGHVCAGVHAGGLRVVNRIIGLVKQGEVVVKQLIRKNIFKKSAPEVTALGLVTPFWIARGRSAAAATRARLPDVDERLARADNAAADFAMARLLVDNQTEWKIIFRQWAGGAATAETQVPQASTRTVVWSHAMPDPERPALQFALAPLNSENKKSAPAILAWSLPYVLPMPVPRAGEPLPPTRVCVPVQGGHVVVWAVASVHEDAADFLFSKISLRPSHTVQCALPFPISVRVLTPGGGARRNDMKKAVDIAPGAKCPVSVRWRSGSGGTSEARTVSLFLRPRVGERSGKLRWSLACRLTGSGSSVQWGAAAAQTSSKSVAIVRVDGEDYKAAALGVGEEDTGDGFIHDGFIFSRGTRGSRGTCFLRVTVSHVGGKKPGEGPVLISVAPPLILENKTSLSVHVDAGVLGSPPSSSASLGPGDSRAVCSLNPRENIKISARGVADWRSDGSGRLPPNQSVIWRERVSETGIRALVLTARVVVHNLTRTPLSLRIATSETASAEKLFSPDRGETGEAFEVPVDIMRVLARGQPVRVSIGWTTTDAKSSGRSAADQRQISGRDSARRRVVWADAEDIMFPPNPTPPPFLFRIPGSAGTTGTRDGGSVGAHSKDRAVEHGKMDSTRSSRHCRGFELAHSVWVGVEPLVPPSTRTVSSVSGTCIRVRILPFCFIHNQTGRPITIRCPDTPDGSTRVDDMKIGSLSRFVSSDDHTKNPPRFQFRVEMPPNVHVDAPQISASDWSAPIRVFPNSETPKTRMSLRVGVSGKRPTSSTWTFGHCQLRHRRVPHVVIFRETSPFILVNSSHVDVLFRKHAGHGTNMNPILCARAHGGSIEFNWGGKPAENETINATTSTWKDAIDEEEASFSARTRSAAGEIELSLGVDWSEPILIRLPQARADDEGSDKVDSKSETVTNTRQVALTTALAQSESPSRDKKCKLRVSVVEHGGGAVSTVILVESCNDEADDAKNYRKREKCAPNSLQLRVHVDQVSVRLLSAEATIQSHDGMASWSGSSSLRSIGLHSTLGVLSGQGSRTWWLRRGLPQREVFAVVSLLQVQFQLNKRKVLKGESRDSRGSPGDTPPRPTFNNSATFRASSIRVENRLRGVSFPVALCTDPVTDSDAEPKKVGDAAPRSTDAIWAKVTWSDAWCTSEPKSISPALTRPGLVSLEAKVSRLVVSIEDRFILRTLVTVKEAQQIFAPRQNGRQRRQNDGRWRSFVVDAAESHTPPYLDRVSQRVGCGPAFAKLVLSTCQPPFACARLSIGAVPVTLTVQASEVLKYIHVGAGRMPLTLSAIDMENVRNVAPARLGEQILAQYLTDAILSAPIILGSLKILGNPTFLIQSVSRGLYDLLSLPTHALSRGPGAFVAALGGGAMSLVRHTSEGTLMSVASLSNTLARNINLITRARDEEAPVAPWAGTPSMGGGVRRLASGVAEGVIGVVSAPVRGALSGGAWGLLGGVGRGLIGAIAKPIAGGFDFVAHTAHGLAKLTSVRKEPVVGAGDMADDHVDLKLPALRQRCETDSYDESRMEASARAAGMRECMGCVVGLLLIRFPVDLAAIAPDDIKVRTPRGTARRTSDERGQPLATPSRRSTMRYEFLSIRKRVTLDPRDIGDAGVLMIGKAGAHLIGSDAQLVPHCAFRWTMCKVVGVCVSQGPENPPVYVVSFVPAVRRGGAPEPSGLAAGLVCDEAQWKEFLRITGGLRGV